MKRFTTFLLIAIAFTVCYSGACTEAQKETPPCTDSIFVTRGKSYDVHVSSKKLGYLGKTIFIEDANGKILAAKTKDGWHVESIEDAEEVMEILIADLENCKQGKK